MKRLLVATFAALFATLSGGAALAAFEKKVALIVGNGAYRNAPALANPVRDARAMAETFGRLGFEVVEGYDVDRLALQQTVRDFAKRSRDADLTVFFYAGHGIAYEGRNYMVPVDAAFADATALDFEAVPVDFITRQMSYADGVSLVFLDACRDNPLATTLARSMGLSTRGGATRGLAQMDVKQAGKGLAIAFATSPGEVAFDGGGDHSPFTTALLKHIDTPATDFTEIMSRVTGEVLAATDERQRPWLNASLTGSVVLNPAAEAQPVSAPEPTIATPPSGDLQAQTLLFNLARETGAANDYRAYLQAFPDGLYAYNARLALAELSSDAGETVVEVAAIDEEAEPSTEPEVAARSGAAPEDAAAAEPLVSAEAIEAALDLSRTDRRELQDRLNLADADVGPADGIFGPMTRAGIERWQGANGHAATGYLDADQVATLRTATEERYAALLSQRAEARAAAERRRAAERQRAAARAKAAARRNAKAKQRARASRPAKRTTKAAKAPTKSANKPGWAQQQRKARPQWQPEKRGHGFSGRGTTFQLNFGGLGYRK